LAFALVGITLVGPGIASASGPLVSQIAVFAGTGISGTPTPGPATSSDLHFPADVALGVDGSVYIADSDNHVIEKVAVGGTLSIIAGDGTAGTPTSGPATSSNLNSPRVSP
jgi:hypothetical protein